MLLGSNSGKTGLSLTRSPQPPDTRRLSSVPMAKIWPVTFPEAAGALGWGHKDDS